MAMPTATPSASSGARRPRLPTVTLRVMTAAIGAKKGPRARGGPRRRAGGEDRGGQPDLDQRATGGPQTVEARAHRGARALGDPFDQVAAALGESTCRRVELSP